MRTMLAVGSWLLAVAAGAILAGAAVAAEPKRGGVLTYAVTGEAPTYDCHATTTYAAVHVLAPHYSLLLRIDPDNYPKLKPDLAESWSVSDDGLVYTFKLRSGVTFHDGTTASSKDIKASFDRLRDPPASVLSARKAAFEDITAIETPDATTVVFRIKARDGSFLDTLALPYNCIYSAAQLEKDQTFPAKKIMGTGPFVFTEHINGSSWSGRRFDNYYDKGLPYLDGFKALFVKSSTLPAAFQGGQIQAEFRSITPGERVQLVNAMKEKIVVQESPWLCRVEVFFNTAVKPFDNPKVRQALSMAIDRWGGSDALSKIAILKEVGGPLRPGSELALPNAELEKLPGYGREIEKSRAEAKRLLAEAGVPNLKFKLLNRNNPQPFTPAGIFVVDQWRRIGVTAEHQQFDVSQQKGNTQSGNYEVGLDTFCADSDDPKPLLLPYLSADRSPRTVTRSKSPQIDALYDALKAAADPAAEREAAYAIQRAVITEANSVPLLWYSRLVAHAASVKGWKVLPSHFANQDLGNVWLDQ